METAGVDWTLPLAVLGAALATGAFFIWRVYASAHKAPMLPAAKPLAWRDLVAKRDALVQQLREMEDTASKRSPTQLAHERYALELEAARTLMALDASGAEPHEELVATDVSPSPIVRPAAKESEAVPPSGVLVGNPALKGFLWGTGSMAAVGLLLFLVSQSARPREEGGSLTGNTPVERRGSEPDGAGRDSGQAPSPDAAEAQLKAVLVRNPGDVDARLDLARVYLGRQDMMAVWNETQDVLKRSPGHPRALSYQALVRLAMGQSDMALGMLKQAIAKQPDLMEAYLHLALVYVRTGRMQDAEATIKEASRRFPDQATSLARLLEELRQQAAQAPPASLEGDPHASVPSPPAEARAERGPAAAAGAPGTPAVAGSARRVAGVVDLDPALRGQLAAGAVVWVTVREAGVEKGPPAAVKRLPASGFPIAFSIGEADSMAGEPLPDRVRVEARVDSDGDPVTRNPSDPSVRIDDVKAGTTDLRLILRR